MKGLHLAIAFLFVNSLFAQDGELTGFNQGRVHYLNNKVVYGLVKLVHGVGGTKVRFKESKSSKAMKLELDDLVSLVIEQDSFAVISKFGTEFSYIPKGIAQIHSLDSIKVYLFKQTISRSSGASLGGFSGNYSSTVNTYLISRNNKDFQGVWNIKEQRIIVSHFFKDYPELMNRIQNKEFDKKTILDIVDEYNNWVKVK